MMKVFTPYVPLTLVTPEGRFVIVIVNGKQVKQVPIEEFDMKTYFEDQLRQHREKGE